jgi:hypothetical protein
MTNFIGSQEFEPLPGEAVNEVRVSVRIETNMRVIDETFRGESAHMQAEAWTDDITEQLA